MYYKCKCFRENLNSKSATSLRLNSLVGVDDGDGVLLEHLDGVGAVAQVPAALAQHGHAVRGQLGEGVARGVRGLLRLRVVGEEDYLEAAGWRGW